MYGARPPRAGEIFTPGLDADMRAKHAAKMAGAGALEAEAMAYLADRTGQLASAGGILEAVADGTLLCALINGIRPGTIKKVHHSKTVMFQNENIEFFQDACRRFGVPEGSLFSVSALREGRDMLQVIQCLLELKRLDVGGKLALSQRPVNIPAKASNWLGGSLKQERVVTAVGAAGRVGAAAARAAYLREPKPGEEVVQGLDADVQAKLSLSLSLSLSDSL